jgi:hypothetical protein
MYHPLFDGTTLKRRAFFAGIYLEDLWADMRREQVDLCGKVRMQAKLFSIF